MAAAETINFEGITESLTTEVFKNPRLAGYREILPIALKDRFTDNEKQMAGMTEAITGFKTTYEGRDAKGKCEVGKNPPANPLKLIEEWNGEESDIPFHATRITNREHPALTLRLESTDKKSRASVQIEETIFKITGNPDFLSILGVKNPFKESFSSDTITIDGSKGKNGEWEVVARLNFDRETERVLSPTD